MAISLCATGLALPGAADAAVFPVTTTADIGDPVPDGACDSGPGGTCPLREAVQEANSAFSPGEDTIELPSGTYSFAAGAPPLAEAAGTGKLTVVGATARDTAIDGGDQSTIFTVPTGGSLELRRLTLRDGKTDASGGGIRNDGTLTLVDMALAGNEAVTGGGAVSSTGTLNVNRVAFVGNESNQPGAAVAIARTGGANPGIATITNSTVAGNLSKGGAALMLSGGGTLTLESSTVSDNYGGLLHAVGGVRVADAPSTLVLANSIVAGNADHDCQADPGGAIVSQGGNLTGDAGCAAGPPADPKLGPLQDNGGPTDTFALLPGSPAIDSVTAPGCPIVDQRGAPRPLGVACDAGAFEGVAVEQSQPEQQQEQQSPPPPPPPPPLADVTAPRIADALATNPVFAVSLRAAAAGRVRTGTAFRFTLSEAARVSLRIARKPPGRGWRGVRTFFRDGAAGSNTIRFSGRVLVGGRPRALPPGRYRVRLQAADGAGNRSAPATIRFRVVAAGGSR
jgi:CSLREA domain-containing protein